MDENNAIIENLANLADGIADLFGKNCEACVHDLSKLPNSLVHISGEVTGRKPGAPATDLLIRLLNRNEKSVSNMHNYTTTTDDGRSLKSATTFVYNSQQKPVAAFCINFDTTDFYNASQALMPLINLNTNDQADNRETFAHSLGETIDALFYQAVEEIGKHPTSMNVQEKTRLTSILEENGTFQLKGSVEQIAHLMGVTKYTVYNYLKKVRNSHEQKIIEA